MTEPTFNPNSILDSTKKALGIGFDYDVFDTDILMHINSVFVTLQQLGVGPAAGFMIEGSDEQWDDFLGGDRLKNNVKTYVYLRVRLLFDPPANAFAVTAMEKQIDELQWRMNVNAEQTIWVDPNPPSLLDDTDVFT